MVWGSVDGSTVHGSRFTGAKLMWRITRFEGVRITETLTDSPHTGRRRHGRRWTPHL